MIRPTAAGIRFTGLVKRPCSRSRFGAEQADHAVEDGAGSADDAGGDRGDRLAELRDEREQDRDAPAIQYRAVEYTFVAAMTPMFSA